MVKRAQLRMWKGKQIDEMENGSRFECSFLTRECDEEWTQKRNRARHLIIHVAVTQEDMCKFGSVKSDECKFCGFPERRSTGCTVVRCGIA